VLDSSWTFGPDEAPQEEVPAPRPGRRGRGVRGPVPHTGWVPRVGLVAAAGAAVIGLLALAHAGPFSSSPSPSAGPTSAPAAAATTAAPAAPVDITGSWNLLVSFHVSFAVEHMTITAEDRATGAFSGTVSSAVGTATISGTVTGSSLSFTIRLGDGSETGTATVATVAGQPRITGTFTNAAGTGGALSAVRAPA